MIQGLHRGKHSHTLGNVKEHEGSPACQTNGRKSGTYQWAGTNPCEADMSRQNLPCPASISVRHHIHLGEKSKAAV